MHVAEKGLSMELKTIRKEDNRHHFIRAIPIYKPNFFEIFEKCWPTFSAPFIQNSAQHVENFRNEKLYLTIPDTKSIFLNFI
jgi:hypothetical protein